MKEEEKIVSRRRQKCEEIVLCEYVYANAIIRAFFGGEKLRAMREGEDNKQAE